MPLRLTAIALLLLVPGCATSLVTHLRKPAHRYDARPVGLEAVAVDAGYQVRIRFGDGTDGGVYVTREAPWVWGIREWEHGVENDTCPDQLRERPLSLPTGPPAETAIAPAPPPRDGLRLVDDGARYDLEVWRGGFREAVLDAYGVGLSLRWERRPWQALLLLAYPLAIAYDVATAPLQFVTYEAWATVYIGLGIYGMP